VTDSGQVVLHLLQNVDTHSGVPHRELLSSLGKAIGVKPELENIVIFSKISKKNHISPRYFRYISSICTYIAKI